MAAKRNPVRRGLTQKELAEMANVSVRTVSRRYAEPRNEFRGRAERRKQKAVQLRAEGLSIRAIAAEMGISAGSVHRYLKDS